jgi:conjugative transposon TraM protein
MENVSSENKEKQRRKILLMAPLIIIPLLAIGFWAIGGGSSMAGPEDKKDRSVLKKETPNANLVEGPKDKLSYYNKASADSQKRLEYMRNDPYAPKDSLGNATWYSRGQHNGIGGPSTGPYQTHQGRYTDPNEERVYERLNSLQAVLNTPPQTTQTPPSSQSKNSALDKREIDRLETLLAMSKDNKSEPDPEIQELHGMLDKVLDIQYPERVRDRYQKKSEEQKGRIFSVSANKDATPISILEKEKNKKQQSAFYSLEENDDTIEADRNTILAVIHETQTLVSGSIVKLRLASDIYINGVLVPKDQFIFGMASLNGERLSVAIDNIRYREHIFPVRLGVFSLDGIEGIHIPGAIGRDAAKQSGSSAISGMNVTTIDPSIAAQAANAGIELTKNLIGRKIKLVKVTVKAGYQVILKDLNEKN